MRDCSDQSLRDCWRDILWDALRDKGNDVTVEDAIKEEISFIKKNILTMLNYMGLKIREEDWHGIQDSASDLRDLKSEIKGLEKALNLIKEIQG